MIYINEGFSWKKKVWYLWYFMLKVWLWWFNDVYVDMSLILYIYIDYQVAFFFFFLIIVHHRSANIMQLTNWNVLLIWLSIRYCLIHDHIDIFYHILSLDDHDHFCQFYLFIMLEVEQSCINCLISPNILCFIYSTYILYNH